MQKAFPWLVGLLGFAIPITTAGSNLLFGVVIIAWLLLPERRQRLEILAKHPVSRAALLLFGVLALGCLYGEASPGDRLRTLGKYADLLLIGLLLPLLSDPAAQRRALGGFAAAMLLILAISTLLWLGLLPDGNWRTNMGTGATVFKGHIQHNWLMANFVLLCVLFAETLTDRRWRMTIYALAALAAANVLFMVIGRVGYVTLLLLVPYWLFTRLRYKGLLLGAAAAVLVAGLGLSLSSHLARGVGGAAADVKAWDPNGGAKTSQGQRLDFWANSARIVVAHPVFGVGTGSFPAAFDKQIAGTNVTKTINPHNEYLMVATQTGIFGLAALLYLFWSLWQGAGRLPPLQRDLARGLVLSAAVGCLFNSFLLDHTEGLFLAWAMGVLFGSARNAERT
jgi:O-antigen ligase